MPKPLRFLDLFAGGGGLSEGFTQAGFEPVAHVESDAAACYTLRTRSAYHWLKKHDRLDAYADYLDGVLPRRDFYQRVPKRIPESIICAEIGSETRNIFNKIDAIRKGKKVDLIIGGPPCQAYSLIGRSRSRNNMREDRRNYLYEHYADFLRRYKPNYFVFENVAGLLSARDETGCRHFDAMRDLFFECGYQTEYANLSANNYGVLQRRKRIILIGRRGRREGFYPKPKEWTPKVCVREVFRDLPRLTSGKGTVGPCNLKPYHGTWQYDAGIRDNDLPVTWHQARPNSKQDLEIYALAVDLWNRKRVRLNYNSLPEHLKTHRHRNAFLDRFKVVAADLPYAHTVVAHLAKDGHYYIHPDKSQNRSITPREAARLQTFPDNYYFEGRTERIGRTSVFSQIGNAVPVLMARKIAEELMGKWA